MDVVFLSVLEMCAYYFAVNIKDRIGMIYFGSKNLLVINFVFLIKREKILTGKIFSAFKLKMKLFAYQ